MGKGRGALALFALLTPGLPGCGSSTMTVTPVMELSTDLSFVIVTDGQPVSLDLPPQGGEVLYVGARVTNLMAAQAELSAKIRSTVDNSIIAEDARTASFVVSTDDPTTWIPEPDDDFSGVDNVPACPAYGAATEDQTFVLEVTVTDTSTNRTATATRNVVPTCRQTDPEAQKLCMCECAANYTLGKCDTP